jgi:effector-binding domain-containing protein
VEVEVVAVEPSLTAVVRVEPVDLSRFLRCYDEVYAFLRGGTPVRQAGHNVALYVEGRMEVGVEVDRSFPPAGEVVPSLLPGGRVARAVHTTGYADLGATYGAIGRWCAAEGHEPTGARWEVYGDPDDAGHVDVEVRFLLRRA